jgi:hypothetical protein
MRNLKFRLTIMWCLAAIKLRMQALVLHHVFEAKSFEDGSVEWVEMCWVIVNGCCFNCIRVRCWFLVKCSAEVYTVEHGRLRHTEF